MRPALLKWIKTTVNPFSFNPKSGMSHFPPISTPKLAPIPCARGARNNQSGYEPFVPAHRQRCSSGGEQSFQTTRLCIGQEGDSFHFANASHSQNFIIMVLCVFANEIQGGVKMKAFNFVLVNFLKNFFMKNFFTVIQSL